METDDPADRAERTSAELMGKRDDWNLESDLGKGLAVELADQLKAWRADGQTTEYITEVFFVSAREVPVKLIAYLEGAFEDVDIQLVNLVARRQLDGTRKLRRVHLTVADLEGRKPLPVAHPGGTWTCKPIGSLGDFKVPPDLSQGFVMATTKEVVAGTAGKMKLKAPLNGDLGPIKKWLWELKKPAMLAVKDNLSYEQLHTLMNGVAIKCDNDKCVRPKLAEKLVLAICP